METILTELKAAGEPTRLRILALCRECELTVTELTQILGQSQPRVSRHLKLLCEAGLLERHREGAWAFFRVPHDNRKEPARLVDFLTRSLKEDPDPVLCQDRRRLDAVKAARLAAAQAYFDANARRWNELRSLYIAEEMVEQALLDTLKGRHIGDFLDIGTGTGRILEIMHPRIGRGTGIDLNKEMLAVARARLESVGAANCTLRQADMYALPFADDSQDAICIHQVLHYADDPAGVLGEAARVLRPGGILLVADFLPHDVDFLREEHAHRRLGFAEEEMSRWLEGLGLKMTDIRKLAGQPLTVALWCAEKPVDKPAEDNAPAAMAGKVTGTNSGEIS